MTRMTALTALLAVLLVAGCGQAERPYRPVEAPAPATTSAAATSSAARPPSTVDVGEDLRVQVAWPARDDQLIRLFPEFYTDSWQAVVSGGDRYLRHVEPPLMAETAAWVRAFTGEERSATGVARLFRLRVHAAMGKGAQLAVCVDETRLRIVSARTGKAITPQPASSRAPYLQTVLAHRGDDGVWRIRRLSHSKEGCSR